MSLKYNPKRPEFRISREKMYDIILAPHVTEKSTLASQNNQFVFKVAQDANKVQIKKAVEALFSVKVEKVNVVTLPGKVKRFKGRVGQRSDIKKAFVTLAQGQTIDMGSGV